MNLPIRMPNGNWVQYPGVSESQHSLACDCFACVLFSGTHCLESQIQLLTGQQIKLSPRFWAANAKVSQSLGGTTYENAWQALLKYGICTEETWPLPSEVDSNGLPTWTWDEFYQSPPVAAYQEAARFLQQWNLDVIFDCSPSALTTAPLWTEVNLGSTTHGVEQLNTTQELNSEPDLAPPGHGGTPLPYIQPLSPVVHCNLLLITPKIMGNVEFVQNGTTGEFGFYLPATSPEALIDKALNFGINIQNPDGSVNFAAAKQVSGL